MYSVFLKDIKSGKPFAFSRFGDGEFNAIMNKRGNNCDGHNYYHDMGVELRAVLMRNRKAVPNYHIGIQDMAKRQRAGEPDFDNLVMPHYTNSNCFHKANIREGNLNRFFDALKGKDVVIVGPEHLSQLDQFQFRMILIPLKNCWEFKPNALSQCFKNLRPGRVFLFCASMMSNVLIDYLWSIDNKCTYIDIGSALDPYVGKNSRSYHKNLNV